jgi:restriction system protein
MILLPDALTGSGPTKILIDGLIDVLVLMWPVLAIIGVLAALPLIVRIVRYRRLARSGIKDIDRFGGKTFEQYLEVLFRRLGYKVERTKFAGDYGGDLVLRKSGVRTVVQAKRYAKSVGVRAVQEVVAAKGYYDCDQSMVVSNSHYTKQARELASKNDVELWDRDMLIQQLTATGAKQAARRAATSGP